MTKFLVILLASTATAAAAPAQTAADACPQEPKPASASACATGSANESGKAASHDVHELEKGKAVAVAGDCDDASAHHTADRTTAATPASGAGGETLTHAISTKGTGTSGRADTQETAGKYSAPITVVMAGTVSLPGEAPAVRRPDAAASERARHDVAMNCIRNVK